MHTAVPLPGTLVWIRQKRWRVEHARLDRHVLRLDVANRVGRLTFLAPFDRPQLAARRERQRHVRRQRAVAQLAGALARRLTARGLDVVVDAGIDVLPHQLEPALAFAHGVRRVLIADVVGAGKTIQAGLVIADLRRRTPSARVLIAVPAALREQWIDELRARFGIAAAAADRQGLEHAARDGAFGGNPWRHSSIWIASVDYLKQPHVRDALPATPWDLFVIDEAHDACGASERHEACDAVAKAARSVLLLTATPHSGDAARFRRLLSLGSLAGDPAPMAIFHRGRRDIGRDARRRIRWQRVAPTAPMQAVFAALRGFEAAMLAHAGDRREDVLLLLSVLRKRATSTMAALDRTLDRRLQYLDDPTTAYDGEWLQSRLNFDDPSDDLDGGDRLALFGRPAVDSAHERTWLRRLRALTATALRADAKIARVLRAISLTREPVVIFTEFRHSLEALHRRVDKVRPTAVLHGAQTQTERQAELRRFLGGDASVLLATDVASQGLNLHTRARWVMSLELPWNPQRLEQRVGRVDRLGQTRAVHVSLVTIDDDAETGLLTRLAARVVAADRALEADAAQPDEHTVGAALLTRTPLPVVPVAAPVPLCDRWRRPARALAASLRARRALAQHWRAPDSFAAAGRTLQAPWASVLVFVTPIVDAHGVIAEQHVAAVRAPARSAAPTDARLLETARAVAMARASRRARRLSHLRAANAPAALRTGAALAAHLRAIRFPEAVQPGMFDHRALHEAASSAADVRAFDENAADREHAAGPVTAARPWLLFDGRGR